MFRKLFVLLLSTMTLLSGVSCSSGKPTNIPEDKSSSTVTPREQGDNENKTPEELLIDQQHDRYIKGSKWITEEKRDWLIEATFDFKSVEQKSVIFQYVDDVSGEDYFYYYTTDFKGSEPFENIGYVFDQTKFYGFGRYRNNIAYEGVTDCTREEFEKIQHKLLTDFGQTITYEDAIKILNFNKAEVKKVEVNTEDNYNFEVDYNLKPSFASEWLFKNFGKVNDSELKIVTDLYIRSKIGDFLGGERVYFSTIFGTCVFDVNGEAVETQFSIRIEPLNNMNTPYQRLDMFEKNLSISANAETLIAEVREAIEQKKKTGNIFY